MARRTFFSFHYNHDVWRANVIRNCNVVLGCGTAGFFDHSEYEEAKKSGDEGIRRMINRRLDGTSVTVVLIGVQTAYRPWVQYEIERSVARGNGLLGVYIHLVGSPKMASTPQGLDPYVHGQPFPTFVWKPQSHNACVLILAQEIEKAGKRSDIRRLGL